MAKIRSVEKSRTSTCAAADTIATAVIAKYRELIAEDHKDHQLVLAGIVAISDTMHLEVLTIGVGNKFHPQGLKSADGIRDCHAEILARRALKRTIIQEYISIMAGNASDWFSRASHDKIRLKQTAKLVLYVSSCPCGNACVRRWGDSPKETMHALNGRPLELFDDSPHPAFEAHSIPEGQASASFKGDSNILSCSDKILRWNVVGIQGARLSAIVDRINLSGIVIGRKFVRKHAQRAFCCRLTWKKVDPEIRQNIHHPALMCTSVKLDEGVFETDSENGSALFSDFAMWWNVGLGGRPEIFNASSSQSLLSKRSFEALMKIVGEDACYELKKRVDSQLSRLGSSRI